MSTAGHRNSLRICLLGDVMLGRLVDQIFPTHVHDPEDMMHARALLHYRGLSSPEIRHDYVWGDVLGDIKAADVRIINLETSVTTHDQKWPDKAFNYRMHPDNLRCLKEANIEYCSLANNHTLDYEVQGMIDTMEALKGWNIKFAGVGKNAEEAMKPAILDVKGTKIAVFSFADHYDFWAAGPFKPGINFLDADNCTAKDIQNLKEHIQKTKEQENVDMVVFSIHWGPNYSWFPSKEKQRFAHEMIDICGVDIIHGHSSHHVQGIEIYRGKPIIYGCGDFVDDYAVDPVYRNDLGFAYFVNWDKEKQKVSSLDLIPTKITTFQATKRMSSSDRAWLENTMKRLCSKFGTEVQPQSDGSLRITAA